MPLTIRNADASDAAALARIYNHYVLNTHITFDLEPVSVDNRLEWMQQFDNGGLHRLFVAEVAGKVVGYTSSSSFRPKPAYYRSVETTIYLAEDCAGNGYGEQLYGHLMSALRETEAKRCYGIIALPNDGSIRLHEKLGFKKVGHLSEVGFKFDQYWDTAWMEKSL